MPETAAPPINSDPLLQPITIPFKDEAHLVRIIQKIVANVGRRIDESNPMCDARMADGSRFNAAIRPIAIQYSAIINTVVHDG